MTDDPGLWTADSSVTGYGVDHSPAVNLQQLPRPDDSTYLFDETEGPICLENTAIRLFLYYYYLNSTTTVALTEVCCGKVSVSGTVDRRRNGGQIYIRGS